MSDGLTVAGVIAAVLFFVKYLIDRAKSDTNLSDLNRAESRKEAEEFAAEIARATKEIEDAKIRFNAARNKLNAFNSSEGSVQGPDKDVQ